jgi:hypothetical protein
MRSKQNAILQNGLTRKRRAYINFPSTIDLRGDFDFLNWLKKINREMCHRNLAQTIVYIAKKYKEISHVDTGETL